MNKTVKRPVHQGQNIQKFRFLRNMSQGDLAIELEGKRNSPVSQQLISDIESHEIINDDELLQQIAEILKIDTEVLKTIEWDAAINVMCNTYTNNSHGQSGAINQAVYSTIHQIFNPLDKLLELYQREKDELRKEIYTLKKENEQLKKGKK